MTIKRKSKTLVPVRILLVDDHKGVRKALSLFLTGEGFSIVGEAASGEVAVLMAQHLQPDVVTMDVRMPGMGGVQATEELLKVSPNSRVIGLSMSNDSNTVLELMGAGACAFVAKNDEITLLSVLHRLEATFDKT